ncbi:putative ATPase [Prosthecobacter fusiformis]|uniref:Putative ATPase n=2 Tax=Prosthecobacter fusiformis TaxID=48464 RepID=A0A4R7RLS3_9BACT|nr:putative ATPase [Prosthecobacter fusiformis]
MRKLNVLIGPNGSGKSNLLEVINLFREAPSPRRSIAGPIMDNGGIDEWMWKGDWNLDDAPPPASVSWVVSKPNGSGVLHEMQFYASNHMLRMANERIESIQSVDQSNSPWWFYRMNVSKKPFVAHFHDSTGPDGFDVIRTIPHDELNSSASILAQIRDPGRYKVFEYLEKLYSGIQMYRDWCFGPQSGIRSPSRGDGRIDVLSRAGENLALMVADMPSAVEARVILELQTLYEDVQGIKARPVAGGNLQLFLTELGEREIPASRLSDGTLRYLALLIILLDAKPPPLIVIEEPELGLHPDVIPQIAKLLKEASERTQLVVTTHSRMLVDALGDDPESVIVCEKHNGESVFERLNAERMAVWLEKYSLGDLWSKGELGGNRW